MPARMGLKALLQLGGMNNMTNFVDVNEPAAAWAVREVVETRLTAGIRVPDSPLITEAIEYARKL
jgi:hypothetical protein